MVTYDLVMPMRACLMSQWSVVAQFGASTGMINFTFRDL